MHRATLLAATLALFVTATAAFAADSAFDKTLTFSGAPVVSVSTGAGYIHVASGPDNQFHVVGHVHAHSGWMSSDEDAAAKQIVAAPPISQSGNTITIGHQGDSDLFRNVSIDYDITTPRSTALTAHTGSGPVEVSGIAGAVSAGSGSGSLHLSLANSSGVKAQTGSGSIRIDGLAGDLHAGTGSGSIEVAGSPTADWRLRTGSGSIHLHLANTAKFTLDASTGSGSVRVDQPIMMQGSLNRHHVSGSVNGGGPSINAATGSGDITINGSSSLGQLGDNNSLHVPGATDCVDNPALPGCRKN
jgi:hypothetical protein